MARKAKKEYWTAERITQLQLHELQIFNKYVKRLNEVESKLESNREFTISFRVSPAVLDYLKARAKEENSTPTNIAYNLLAQQIKFDFEYELMKEINCGIHPVTINSNEGQLKEVDDNLLNIIKHLYGDNGENAPWNAKKVEKTVSLADQTVENKSESADESKEKFALADQFNGENIE